MRSLTLSLLIVGSLLAGCVWYGDGGWGRGRDGGHYGGGGGRGGHGGYYHHHDWR